MGRLVQRREMICALPEPHTNCLRMVSASYTDIFKLLEFDEEVDPAYGILVDVKRTSDNKKFTLSLSDLEATDKQSTNYQLLDDFSVWFVNFR